MKETLTIKINAWFIVIALILSNFATVLLWHPWSLSTSDRTIEITGTTVIEAEPDQYTFNPYYQKEGTDQTTINQDLQSLSTSIVGKLKELGVEDSTIQTSISSYPYYYERSDTITGTLYITVNIKDKALAQKVQDYISSSNASGSITPSMSFSSAKQKELETKAREDALLDAKSKAETSVTTTGARLGKVISIEDASGYNGSPLPWLYGMTSDAKEGSIASSDSSTSSLQPGVQEYTFNVKVTYELQ